MSEQQDKSALPVGTIVRGYRLLGLLDVLGIGDFGVTYMVEDSESGERVAVKEYLPIQFAMFAVRDGATVHPKFRQAKYVQSQRQGNDKEWHLRGFFKEGRH